MALASPVHLDIPPAHEPMFSERECHADTLEWHKAHMQNKLMSDQDITFLHLRLMPVAC